MLILLTSVALALEAGVPEAQPPQIALEVASEDSAPVAEITAELERDRERLEALLATERWYVGLEVPLVTPETPLVPVIGALVEGGLPRLVETEAAIAERLREREEAWWVSDLVRSNARVQHGDDGRVEALAFGIQQATQGRGVTRTTLDVLVVYEADRPSRVFASYRGFHGWRTTESQWTLTTDAEGRVIGAQEVALVSETELDAKPGPELQPRRQTRALRRTWKAA